MTDGLPPERELLITIDVAYRDFATPKRKFIIADTPGHIQYTRNMVTGASTANLAIILVDARKGVIEQTCRHAFIANLLRIQNIVVCVNKMDLVNWDQDVFDKIVNEFKSFSSRLDNLINVTFIPASALLGDNIVDKSVNMDWYNGSTLLYHLETVYNGSDFNHIDSRFPVQWVVRPHSDKYHDFRGFAGRIAGGVFKPGDSIKVLPSGFKSKIKSIHLMDEELKEAYSPMSVVMTLEDEIDISRGNMLVKENNQPNVLQDIDAMICWFSSAKSLSGKGKFIVRHTTNDVQAIVSEVKYKVNINTLHKIEDDLELKLNDIGRISIRTSAPLFVDSYSKNRITGSIILIDPLTNETVAAGMII